MSEAILEIRLGGYPWSPTRLLHAACEADLEEDLPYMIWWRHARGEGACVVCGGALDAPPAAGEEGG